MAPEKVPEAFVSVRVLAPKATVPVPARLVIDSPPLAAEMSKVPLSVTLEPAMAPDGSYLVFASNRPAHAGGSALDGYFNNKPRPGRGGNLWRVTGDINEEDERYALQAIREIAEDIGEGRIGATAGDQAESEVQPPDSSPAEPPIPIFACPAHDAEDRVALEMLQHVLDPARWDLELMAPGILTAELLDLVAERRPGAVCIAA